MKTLSFLFIGIFFLCSFLGAPLLANGIDTIVNNAGGNSNEADSTLPTLESNQGKKAEQKTNTIIYFIINLILVIAGSIAVFLLVIGGVEYTISGGTEDRMNHAKSTITMALIGLAVIIFSYAIVGNVAKFLEAPY